MNQFFNPVVIAARTIAVTVKNQANVFSTNFNTSLYPPIIKEYAADNKQGMFQLIYNGSKMTFFLMWVFVLPLYLHMDYVLTLWLKNPPDNAVFFTRLALFESIINASALPIMTAARAQGKMKWYELPLGSLQLFIFIVDWILLRLGFDAWVVFIVAAGGNAVMYLIRLIFVKKLVGLPIFNFIRFVIIPLFFIAILSAIPSYFISHVVPNKFLFVLLSVMASVCFSTTSFFFLGIDKSMRKKIVINLQKRLKFKSSEGN